MTTGLANDLRAAREAAGWTQAQLAERVGVSRKTINTVENGVFIPSTLLALKLARALGRPVEALFSLADESDESAADGQAAR
jgi:putative transcriptional regulator